jgi:hypothetical protein
MGGGRKDASHCGLATTELLEVMMRKISIPLILFLLLAVCVAQSSRTVTVAGCIESVNGEFHLLTSSRTYILKGHHDKVFGYNGKQVEIVGTIDAGGNSAPQGIPVVLHISKIKKVADFCQ